MTCEHCFTTFYNFRISRLNQWNIVGCCEECQQWFVLRNVESCSVMRKLDQPERDYLKRMIALENHDHACLINSPVLAQP